MRHLKIRLSIGDILFLAAMSLAVAFPQPSSYKALAIVAFFGYTVVVSLGRGFSTKNAMQYFWAIVFGGYCYFSKVWSVLPEAANEVLNNVLWSMLLSVAVVNYVVINRYDVYDIVKRLIFVIVVFVLNILANGDYVKDRLTLIMGDYSLNANAFGQIAISLACFLLYCCKKRGWRNFWFTALLIALVVFALLSGSRKVLISIGIYAVMILMYEYPPTDFTKMFVRPLIIVGVLGFALLCIMNIEGLYATLGVRIESALAFFSGDDTADGSAATRMQMIETAWNMFTQKPITGYGLNTFAEIAGFNAYAHNNYLELLANLGLVGVLVYYCPLLGYLRKAYWNWRRGYIHSVLPLSIIAVSIISDIGMVSYFSMVSHAFLALAIGMSINISSNPERELKAPAQEEQD